MRDDVGPYFQQKLRALAGHPAVGEVARLPADRRARAAAARRHAPSADADTLLGVAAAALAREEGVIVRGIRDLIALAPPLVVTHAEIDAIFAAVERGLDRLWG